MLLNGSPLNGAPLNGDGDVDPVAGDAYPLVLGPVTLVDLSLNRTIQPYGLRLATAGQHTAELSPLLPSDQFSTAGGAEPLKLGGIQALVPSPIEATAGDAEPLVFGPITIKDVAIAGDAEPLLLGGLGAAIYSATAGDALPLLLGAPRLVIAVRPQGLRLGIAGIPVAEMGGAEAEAGDAYPLVLGDLQPFAYAAVARAGLPLKLGNVTLTRGNAC